MTARTNLLNQKFIIANQLGFVNQDVIFDTPNLGTKNDPIPYDKTAYFDLIRETNPNATVYVKTKSGKILQQNVSNLLPE